MKKILVVDDDPLVRRLVCKSLAGNYECVEAPDGETALDLVERERPDAIVIDWILPGLSGPNVFKRLKRYVEYRTIPILIMSARGEEQTRAAAEELGAAGYISKPFDVKDLRAAVAHVLEAR